MKKIILILSLTSLMATSSCRRTRCNCGYIKKDDPITFSILIKNNCTGNEKWFAIDPDKWAKADVGEYYCIKGLDDW